MTQLGFGLTQSTRVLARAALRQQHWRILLDLDNWCWALQLVSWMSVQLMLSDHELQLTTYIHSVFSNISNDLFTWTTAIPRRMQFALGGAVAGFFCIWYPIRCWFFTARQAFDFLEGTKKGHICCRSKQNWHDETRSLSRRNAGASFFDASACKSLGRVRRLCYGINLEQDHTPGSSGTAERELIQVI